jgi:hypothetical protein
MRKSNLLKIIIIIFLILAFGLNFNITTSGENFDDWWDNEWIFYKILNVNNNIYQN